MSAILKALQNRKTVELKSEVVELGLVDDLKKVNNDFRKTFDTAKKVTKMRGDLRDLAQKGNKEQDTFQKESKKLIDKAESAAKELGVDISKNIDYMNAKANQKASKDFKTMFDFNI